MKRRATRVLYRWPALLLAAVLAVFGIVSSGWRVEAVTTAEGWEIADPGLLYVGMEPVQLTLVKKGENADLPTDVTWSVQSDPAKESPVTIATNSETKAAALTAVREGTARITAASGSEEAALEVYVWFSKEKTNAASYTYTGSSQGWEFSTSLTNVTLSSPTYTLLDSEGRLTDTAFTGGSKPTDAGTYQVSLEVTDKSDTPAITKKGTVGTFVIEPKSIEQVSLPEADAPFTTVDAFAVQDVTKEKDNLTLSIVDALAGDDATIKTATARGVFTYPKESVHSVGRKTDGTAVLTNLSASLKNYRFEESYTLTVPYEVIAAPTSLTVKTQPKLSYTEGEALDLSGLVVALSENGQEKEVPFAEFGDRFTVLPSNGTVLEQAHTGTAITVTDTVSGTVARTDALTVSPKPKTTPSLTVETPASGPAGGSISVAVKFDRKDSEKPYPAADRFTLSDDQSTPQSAAFKAEGDGVYTATYNLPSKETQVVLTVSFKGDDNFEDISVSSNTIGVSIENPVPSMTLSADKTSLPGGGTVVLTVKMTAPEGAPALPGAGEIVLTNNRDWTGKLSGSGGLYTASCTLPNQVDVVEFTASFGGNKGFSKAEDAVCTVETSYAAYEKGAEVENAVSRLPSATDAKQMDAPRKALLEKQLRVLIENISQLSDSQKRYVKTDALEHMDALLAAVTGAKVSGTTVSSYYSEGSSSRVQEGAGITGALAAANAENGNTISLRIDQSRNGSSRTFLQVDLSLRKQGKEVELLTPVEVSIPLPENYIKRSGVSLRHRKSSGGYEYPSFSITGEKGSYILTFRANSFSLYTLYLPTADSERNDTPESYYIRAKAGSGGTISPTGNVEVEAGKNQTFTIKPKAGYMVDRVLVDGDKYVALREDNTYTFKEVDQPYTIEVHFKPVPPASAASPAPASSAPPASQSQKPPSGGSAAAPASSAPESSSPEAASSEDEPPVVSSEPPAPSEPEPSPSSEAVIAPDVPGEDTGGGLSDKKDLAVAVVIVIIVVALSMAAIFFGVYLSRRRDEDYAGEDDEDYEDYDEK